MANADMLDDNAIEKITRTSLVPRGGRRGAFGLHLVHKNGIARDREGEAPAEPWVTGDTTAQREPRPPPLSPTCFLGETDKLSNYRIEYPATTIAVIFLSMEVLSSTPPSDSWAE